MEFSVENTLAALAGLTVAPLEIDALLKGTRVACVFVHGQLGPMRAELWIVDRTVHVQPKGLSGAETQHLDRREAWQKSLLPQVFPVAAYPTLIARFALENGLCPP